MPKTKWESVIFTAYKFFDSKELLFFVVLEDIHTEGFAVAQHSLQGNAAESLLRRLPQDILSPTTMTMRDTSGRCRRRAACVPVAAPLWPPPAGA